MSMCVDARRETTASLKRNNLPPWEIFAQRVACRACDEKEKASRLLSRAGMLRHVNPSMGQHDPADVEDAPSMVRSDSCSGTFASAVAIPTGKATHQKKETEHAVPSCQTVATWIVALLLVLVGVLSILSLRRIEQSMAQKDTQLRETHAAVAAIGSVLREHSKSHMDALQNLDALKAEQVNVMAGIPSAISSDILPQLDRLEAALVAHKPPCALRHPNMNHGPTWLCIPSCAVRLILAAGRLALHRVEFNTLDRLHLNRLLVSLHKISDRISHVEQLAVVGHVMGSGSTDPGLQERAGSEGAQDLGRKESHLFRRLNSAQKPV